MKKLGLTFILFLVLSLIWPVMAKSETLSAKNSGLGEQAQTQLMISPSATGISVKNQNQIKTQNQGEETQIQTQNQEEETQGEGAGEGLQNRNQNALENMSMVAQKVQELLQTKTTGGIGEQVREIARDQNQAQLQIEEEMGKINSKGKLARLFTGTDHQAVKNLERHLEQNRLRIEQLEQLQNQLKNQDDLAMVQEAIQALIQENTSLQEMIEAEEQVKSFFGWLLKLLVK